MHSVLYVRTDVPFGCCRGCIMAYGDRNFRNRPQREYFKTTCTACGKECEVPFKPTEGKPVYCKECYAIYAPPREDRRRRF